jgi:hypothetical protein
MSNLHKGPSVETLYDGALVLSFHSLYPDKNAMETDLVFASGAFVADDPMLNTQREIMEEIVKRWNAAESKVREKNT